MIFLLTSDNLLEAKIPKSKQSFFYIFKRIQQQKHFSNSVHLNWARVNHKKHEIV